jgi:2-hydroxy-3-keto-5-methylthiopentenyl-1-phosphate phosphatase
VQALQDKGECVVYAGDGPPDLEPARFADVVFAKKILLNNCKNEGIKTEVFRDFKDIYHFFERMIANHATSEL